ncbi:unnamed protein product [Ilex paraguariensis]|uniref:S-adenosylmethionine-dependent methyltransferase n=1 Tax=Ilex paraguariensis TaxID=185542 RepID=A0ABC8RC34_9AQUA
MAESFPMNGGDGTYNYTKNSQYQREASNIVKEIIDEAIAETLDVKSLTSTSPTFRIADLGCSVPEKLLDKNSPAWNKGRIHYTGASDDVVHAYTTEFEKDMEIFLNTRGKEIVDGGMMGIIDEAQVDSFNLPIYAASPKEMSRLVERNGNFTIEKIELTDPRSKIDAPINVQALIMHLRAAMEGMFSQHFGRDVVDELFERTSQKCVEISDRLQSTYMKGTQLFIVLKCK